MLFLTPASVLSALRNVKQATTLVHHVTLHFCIVLRKRSTGFGNHQCPSFPGSHRLVDSIFRGELVDLVSWFACIPLFTTQEPLVSNMAYLSTQSPLNSTMVVPFFTVVFKIVMPSKLGSRSLQRSRLGGTGRPCTVPSELVLGYLSSSLAM